MKKYLSLIAIMALMVSYAMAQAPVFTGVPDVKLYSGRSLSSAFDLATYNTGPDAASTFSVTGGVDVASITPLAPGTVSYFGLVAASSTWRTVTFSASNDGGATTASQIVKYSSYLVKKLGRISLAASDSQIVDVSAIANLAGSPSYPGTANFPPSFSDAAAVVADAGISANIDTTAKTLAVSNTGGALTAVKYVRLNAGPSFSVTSADYDKGILKVYPNLLLNGKFDSGLSNWTTQIYGGAIGTGTISVEPSFGGKSNVYKAAQTAGQKAQTTQIINGVTPNQWFTARAKVATDATDINAAKQKAFLYIYDDPFGVLALPRNATDIIQPGYFKPASVWNDMEISFYAKSTSVAVQFVSISNAAATVGSSMYWDDIELFAAPPAVDDSELTYGNTAVAITNGSFDSDTSSWAYEGYGGAAPGTISWAASQTGRSGVLQVVQVSTNKAQASQNNITLGAGKSAKLSAFVLTNAPAGSGGKYYAYIYSTSTTSTGGVLIQKSATSIIQPGAIASNTWEEIKVGMVPSTDLSSIQIVTITGAKPAQTHYVDAVTLAVDKDPIYFWDSTLFP